ncbi:MAG TPA: TIGR01777 family oxidoreductase [Candidatus Sulfotelmatobacter sp.]|jgi:uncharacterized protein (TIGR01777 family)|nr:TIGR01777 family oxidoreductase [Candidatus Sulfotelmatobacter sp.]
MTQNAPRIVIAGGTGFLGRALIAHLQGAGYACTVLTRSPSPKGGTPEIRWDGRTLGDWTRELEGAHAVIDLAGRSVNCRYHERNRQAILDSRVEPTRIIGQAIARCQTPPKVWLNASTATIYKHTFGPAWNEAGEIAGTREARDEFSVAVATAWEKALDETPTPRTRKLALRAAMVLGTGANSVFPVLKRLVRLGLGGRIGDGRQYVSWIHENDFCRAVEWLMTHDTLAGPVNICAPNPLSNADMMKTFRAVCGVPIGLPATRWMLEIGTFVLRTESELVIKSRRVVPGKLLASGFEFRYPTFREAAQNLITQTLPISHNNQQLDWNPPPSKKKEQPWLFPRPAGEGQGEGERATNPKTAFLKCVK